MYHVMVFWSILSSYSSSVRSQYVFSLSIKVSVTDRGWKRGAESQRLDSALRVGPQSFRDDCMLVNGTSSAGISRSDGTTSQVLSRIKFCHVYQVMSKFSTLKRV